jgi:flagellar hook-length control protein FliK
LKKVATPAGEAVASAPEQGETAGQVKTSANSDSSQVESVKIRSMVRPVLDAYFKTSPVPSSKNVMVDVTPVGQTGTLARLDAVNADAQAILTARIPTGMPQTVFPSVQEEAPTAPKNRAEGVEGLTTQNENVVAEAIKGTMSTDSGGSSDNQDDGRGTFDRQAGVQNHVIQLKSEQTQLASSQTETSREAVRSDVLRQVVDHVREHLARQENRNGVEQVVIRLSPENLGELKLNLRMENQCLKVEIVAENSMVRDTLIKHSDTLKESLASQNITMETFDVSTGNNGNGAGSYGQRHADWQELARQRQNAAWHSSGGYRLSSAPEISKKTVYMALADCSMLDVHF